MRFMQLTVLLLTGFSASVALAKGKHHHSHGHKAHSHGDATLDVAADGKALTIELNAPGDVVFGFEHKARTPDQEKIITTEVARLNEKYGDLFVLPQDAKCVLTEKVISAPQAAAATEKDDQEEGKKKRRGKGKKKGHGVHADVKATYNFTCESDLKSTKMKLAVFAAWPRLKNLKVQILGSSGQKGLSLKNDNTELDL